MLETFQVLLEAGANADQADVDGWTPLRAAAWGGHTEVSPHNTKNVRSSGVPQGTVLGLVLTGNV